MHTERLRFLLRPVLVSSLSLLPLAATAAEQKPGSARKQETQATKVVREPIPLASATISPPKAKPGELVQVDVVAEGASRLEGKLFDRSPHFFEVSPGKWRAWAAIPVSTEPGRAELELTVHRTNGSKHAMRAGLGIEERPFTEHTLRVAKKFTSPSREHRKRMLEDRMAFRKAYRVKEGPPLFTANFLNPREGAALNSRFGEKRVFNGKLQSRHMGLDLDGNTGDPILAANDGVVTMVRECFGSGNTVIVSHGAGLFTGYFHLSEFKVKQGDKVKRGQLLGLVGKTGRVTGPHLHLSAKANGLNFDPESLLSFDFGGSKEVATDLGAAESASGN